MIYFCIAKISQRKFRNENFAIETLSRRYDEEEFNSAKSLYFNGIRITFLFL